MNPRDDMFLNRRTFLQASALTAVTGSIASAANGRSALSFTPVNHNCIVIANTGGMSHIDLWDPKPLAPTEIRGEFAPIATSVPGLFISELLPRTARIADRLAIVRSVAHGEAEHGRAARLMKRQLGRDREILDPLERDGRAEKAIRRLRSACRPIETDSEQDVLHDAYGQTAFGQSLLRARQEIEAGERFVQVDNGHWDTHSHDAVCLREILAPVFDQAFAALIHDLADRGLLATTRVIVTTEFGRSPHRNSRGGRDHWPGAFSIVMAGGGAPAGAAIGRTDKHGAMIVDQAGECSPVPGINGTISP